MSEEKDKDKEQVDRFTELMFGSSFRKKEKKQDLTEENEEQEQPKTDEVNYFHLMSQIDDIMGSWENLKPMIKEFSPLVDYFKKKK